MSLPKEESENDRPFELAKVNSDKRKKKIQENIRGSLDEVKPTFIQSIQRWFK